MSVLAKLPWMSLLALSKDEKQTIENLKTMATSFGVTAIAHDSGITGIVAALRGEESAPAWLVKMAKMARKATANGQSREVSLTVIKSLAEQNGFQYQSLVSLLRKFAPVLDVNVENLDDDEVVLNVLATIGNNVIDSELNPQYTGVVTCPKCKFTHIV